MAVVANGMEVSLTVERMDGSERPTHQPAAAPAHTHTHKNARVWERSDTLAAASVRHQPIQIVRWKKKNRHYKMISLNDSDLIDCIESR